MSYYYEYELGKATKILCEELFKLKSGETFIITADTESDKRVVDATARAAFACDAKPMVIYTAYPLGVGKAADKLLPVEALSAALTEADAWVEFNNGWLLYSTPYDIATAKNPKLRYLNACGMDVDMMVRLIGRVDFPILEEFMSYLLEITMKTKHMKVTTPAGTNVEFDNDPDNPVVFECSRYNVPGSHMTPGQIAWSPKFETINGDIVFDGSIVPPIKGILREPVRLIIKNGEITKIEGGKEAIEYDKWLKSFNHPQMLKLAHISYGLHPNAQLSGNVVEDERIWGATEWGIGNVGPILVHGGISGPSHSDGICLNSSIWLDNVQILDKGVFIEPKLKELARKLGK
ncbi:MAG: aminopeptidase [Candidatus Caldatribacteriota bacterium]